MGDAKKNKFKYRMAKKKAGFQGEFMNFKNCAKVLVPIFTSYMFFSSAAFAVIDPADILTAADGEARDQLGWSVAIDGYGDCWCFTR